MASSSIADPPIDYQQYDLTVYSDGSIHRTPWEPSAVVAACPSPSDPLKVASTDVTLNERHGTCLRLFLPPLSSPASKIPIFLHFHGGAFMHCSTSFRPFHAYLCGLATHVNSLVVSVEYRLAPEHPLPAAYEDCYEALLWLDKQAALGQVGEPWLANHANFSQCFLCGDSAGGTIAHYVAAQALGHGSWETQHKEKGLNHLSIKGMLLFHPFFVFDESSEESQIRISKVLKYIGVDNRDHPLVNPASSKAPALAPIPLPRALVFVGGLDEIKQGGLVYHDSLVKAGKETQLSVAEEETHCFFIYKPESPNVIPLLDEVRDFICSPSHGELQRQGT